MRIGLIDIDSHNFPNLCLMKLSAYFKRRGDEVDLLKPADVLNGINLFYQYDEYYGACVFSWNSHIADMLDAMGVTVGGTGTKSKQELEPEIEHIMPDYSLYGITDTSYGFLTRGCPRHCPFCVVGDKEGLVSRKVADLSEFWNGQKNIVLCDPNLLACSERMDLLKQLADSKAEVNVNQGFDARLLTEEVIAAMNEIKLNMLHFAWDNPRDEIVKEKLLLYSKHTNISNERIKTVYILTNYWSNHEEDLYRIYWLRDNGYTPYVMIYNKEKAPRKTRLLQRWCNNRIIFRSCARFEDYDPKRG